MRRQVGVQARKGNMAFRGNLYWEISFTALYHGAADCTENEKIEVEVSAHDFKDAYDKAKKMYTALLHSRPDTVSCVVIRLRDDGTAGSSARYGTYQLNYCHEDDVPAFFSSGADKCMRHTRIV